MNPCEKMLQDGLYQKFDIVNTADFNQDMKDYLSSDTFKSDYEVGKWGGSLATIIDGSPFDLDANASDEKLKTFQQNIRTSHSFSMSQKFYSYASSRIPDVALAKVYSDCLIGQPYGLHITSTSAAGNCVFTIDFKPLALHGPIPHVTYFDIINGKNVKNAPHVHSVLNSQHIVTCDIPPGETVTLVIETDQGSLSLSETSAPVAPPVTEWEYVFPTDVDVFEHNTGAVVTCRDFKAGDKVEISSVGIVEAVNEANPSTFGLNCRLIVGGITANHLFDNGNITNPYNLILPPDPFTVPADGVLDIGLQVTNVQGAHHGALRLKAGYKLTVVKH